MRIVVPFVLAIVMSACGPSSGGNGNGNGNGNDDDDDDDDVTQPDAADLGFIDASSFPPNEFIDGGAGSGACAKMDILFVVDDSLSMEEEQASLIANFPLFYGVLDGYEVSDGVLLDYRVAVTTTGTDANATYSTPFGDFPAQQTDENNGAFRQECGMTRPWLERGDSDVQSQFSCIADVGTDGPSLEMQLYATKLALARPENGAFLREDALLAIVILSDEDDCSVEDYQAFSVPNDQCQPRPPQMASIQSYVDFLDDTKELNPGDGRGRWAAAVISGDSSCPDSYGDGERLREFKTLAGDNVIHRPICVPNLADALTDAIEQFSTACESFPPIP